MPPLEDSPSSRSSHSSSSSEVGVATPANEAEPSHPLSADHPQNGNQVTSTSQHRPSRIQQAESDSSSSPSGSPYPPATLPKTNGQRATDVSASPLPATELDREIARLTKVVQATSSQAAGRVLQGQWRQFLFTDNNDDHLCWILRAGLKNAPINVIERVLRDQNILNALGPAVSKTQPVVETVLSQATHAQVRDHVGRDVLDKALSERLKMAPAKQIIKWLAEAERLGYREDDILDDEDESVIPNIPNDIDSEDGDVRMTDSAPLQHNLALHSRDSLLAQQAPNSAILNLQQEANRLAPINTSFAPLRCPVCYHQFTTQSGYSYHAMKKVCAKIPPDGGYKWICNNCVQGFTTKHGLQYHGLNKVCLDQDIAPATSPSSQLHHEAAAPPRHYEAAPILPPTRPTFSATQTPQSHNGQPPHRPQPSEQPRPFVGTPVSRPPLHIPASSLGRPDAKHSTVVQQQATVNSNHRLSPSELTPQKLAELNRALAEQEVRYQTQCAEVDPTLGPQERVARLTSLKNANATRKSQIRKSYNVTLRMGEKEKAARDAAASTPSSRPNLEGYRAAPVSRASNTGGTTPYLASPLASSPSSSFPTTAEINNISSQLQHAPAMRVGNVNGEKAKKVPVKAAQAMWHQRLTNGDVNQQQTEDTPMPDAEASSGNGQGEAITILSSSEDEDIEPIRRASTSSARLGQATPGAPVDVPEGSEGESGRMTPAAPPRGFFTAKRGRH